MLFRFDKVAKEFGSRLLFEEVSVQANPGEHIGLIGVNGSGKTTFFDLLESRLTPDRGRVLKRNDLRISRVEQIPDVEPDTTLRDQALEVFAYLKDLEREMRELEHEMSDLEGSVPAVLASRYEALQVRHRFDGGFDYEARTEAVLFGLGFSRDDLGMPCRQLSGGQQSRLQLAWTLLSPADLLLLDEPTNHLDLDGILWLDAYLSELKTGFLLISHDRHFLDAVTTVTWEIEQNRLHTYPGNFSKARRLREERLRLASMEYERQQEWKSKTEDFVRRNIAGQKTKQAQSRRKTLAKTEWLEKPGGDGRGPALRIQEAQRGGSVTLLMKEARFGYADNTLIEHVDLVIRRGDRVAFLGGNGSGKTTVLKTLSGEVPLLSGKVEWGVNTVPSYFSQNPSLGENNRTVYDALREIDSTSTDFELRSLAARFMFREEDIYKSLPTLSGGERSRLALARLFYYPTNVVILDEPTNHLDIQSREALEAALADYSGTLIVVSHDLYFVERVTERHFRLHDRQMEELKSLRDLSSFVPARIQEDPEVPEPTARPAKAEKPSGPSLSKNELARRKRAVAAIESKIHQLELRKEEIVAALVTERDFVRLHELSEEHHSVEEDIAALYEEWLGQDS